jgi:ABC-type transport system involved in multi-copper enzyme maturation permease subunit
LHLSLLPPREIIAAKFAAPLIACFYYSLPILPVLAFYVNYSIAPRTNQVYGVPVPQAVATIMILVGASAVCTAWGLLLSALCTRTLTAVGWTLATLLLALVLVPAALAAGSVMHQNEENFLLWWHPSIALQKVQGGAWSFGEVRDASSGFQTGLIYMACMAFASLCLLLATGIVLRRQMRNFGIARKAATSSADLPPGAEASQVAG